MTNLPLCAAILLNHLPYGQGAPTEMTLNMEFHGSLATGTKVRTNRFSLLLFGISWILGNNFAFGLARASSPAHQQLHKTRLQLEANQTNPSPQDSLPKLNTAPEALLDRKARSIPENTTEEVPRAPKPLSWGNQIALTIASWLWPVAAFIKPAIKGVTESNLIKELPRTECEAPIEVT